MVLEISDSVSGTLCLLRRKRTRIRAMLIASGRSRLTTRPTVFMERFATAIRHLSCAEISADAKVIHCVPPSSAKDRIRVVLRGRIPLAVYDRDRVDVVASRAL